MNSGITGLFTGLIYGLCFVVIIGFYFTYIIPIKVFTGTDFINIDNTFLILETDDLSKFSGIDNGNININYTTPSECLGDDKKSIRCLGILKDNSNGGVCGGLYFKGIN